MGMHAFKLGGVPRMRARLSLVLASGALLVGGMTFLPARAASSAAAPQPAKKDTRRAQPTQVHLSTSVTPAEAKAGETVTYQVTARVDAPYHIYALVKQQKDEGPKGTEIDLFDTGGLKVAGDWKPSSPPVRHKDPNFKDLEFVEYHEGEVTWGIPLRIPGGTEPGKRTLRSQISYMICSNSGNCSLPGQWTVPDATLTVLPGGAPTEAASAPPPAPASGDAGAGSSAGGRSTAPVATTEVQKSLEQGIIPFLLLSVGAGLISLVMPCVWPMVPITVNFFVKQGHANRGKTTGLAVVYCAAIIVIFTTVGVLFSMIFGASSLPRLAASGWLNALVAVLFLAFGLSLLGLFEIRLPSFLLNASARGEGRGGVVGVIFMATTLTITSFTCTFPVVGALLVMAAGGQFFYPILGLATFATVLALPFFLLALSPGLLARVPRSGDWMNAVKIVGGLLEIGAALKFVNNAEIGYGADPADAWFNAQTVLTLWIVLAAVCGIYLLGLFRTDHDHDTVRVGPSRMLLGSLFVGLALFLLPALFGRPPQSRVWDRLVVGLLPPDDSLTAGVPASSAPGSGPGTATTASSKDPEEALAQETRFHGVVWGMSFPAARERARRENKPILIDFTGVFCANCRQMERSVMPRSEVVARLEKFVTVSLFSDQVPIKTLTLDQKLQLAEDNASLEAKLVGENTLPLYVALMPDGTTVLKSIGGFREPPAFVAFLDQALAAFEDRGKVAQASLPADR